MSLSVVTIHNILQYLQFFPLSCLQHEEGKFGTTAFLCLPAGKGHFPRASGHRGEKFPAPSGVCQPSFLDNRESFHKTRSFYVLIFLCFIGLFRNRKIWHPLLRNLAGMFGSCWESKTTGKPSSLCQNVKWRVQGLEAFWTSIGNSGASCIKDWRPREG